MRTVHAFLRDRRGGVSLLTAFALPALIGTMAMGTEVAFWLLKNRSLQNAADSAVVAASLDGTAAYLAQAKAVTSRYGLTDGTDGVTVTASNAATCPTGETGCYSVTVATAVPVYLGAVLGYFGNTTADGLDATRISAIAIARPGGAVHPYCLVALATNGVDPGIDTRGAPKSDLSGCGVASSTGMTCKGHDLKADFGDAGGINDGCGAARNSNVKQPVLDPYKNLAASIPPDPCGGSFPQSPAALPASSRWSGTKSLGSTTTVCGDLQLNGDVTITAPADAVVYIRNGDLLTNGFRLQTASGSGVALVFAGTNSASYSHIPNGTGSIDIAAPTAGTWAGVAAYQDPALTVGVQIPNAASKPGWAFSGLVYLPHADLSFSGSVGKASQGAKCTVLVANSISVNGTGLALSTLECPKAGLAVPTNGATGRGGLVG